MKPLYLHSLLVISVTTGIYWHLQHNQETMDGATTGENHVVQNCIIDAHGAIVRGDTAQKELAMVFTGDEFADGGMIIHQTLRKHSIKASFFFTGKFYANAAHRTLVTVLQQGGHYLGAHSDQHLLYADWINRDSLLVTRDEFTGDLLDNYKRMADAGIEKTAAPYFLPPYEWYNAAIAGWTKQLGLQLVSFTPGTRSAADYTYPEMGTRYVASDRIYQSILRHEENDPHGMNGFILLMHIGTDARRTDKLYYKLDSLVTELKGRGYRFATITALLE